MIYVYWKFCCCAAEDVPKVSLYLWLRILDTTWCAYSFFTRDKQYTYMTPLLRCRFGYPPGSNSLCYMYIQYKIHQGAQRDGGHNFTRRRIRYARKGSFGAPPCDSTYHSSVEKCIRRIQFRNRGGEELHTSFCNSER